MIIDAGNFTLVEKMIRLRIFVSKERSDIYGDMIFKVDKL